MIPRWLWLNHVPEGLEPTPEQARRMLAGVRELVRGRRHVPGVAGRILVRLAPVVALLVLAFLAWLMWLVHARRGAATMIMLHVAGILAFQALIWLAIAWSINRTMAPLVWRALNQIGIRVCERCGYILDHRPLDVRTCPECGDALRPPTSEPAPAVVVRESDRSD